MSQTALNIAPEDKMMVEKSREHLLQVCRRLAGPAAAGGGARQNGISFGCSAMNANRQASCTL
jgi:hypothetical protein